MSEDNETGRRLRQKERRIYTDEGIDEDEIEGKRTFSVDQKLRSNRFNANLVKEVRGDELNYKYIQEHGFTCPLVIKDKTGLGMRMPSKNFKVSDVKQCVGSRRMLDVMDVTTQKGIEMTMKEWARYYENTERERLLNVISLEFSHTKLENYVEQPTIVRQMDWVDTMWPRHLKECQTESTNIIEKMKYPKVQKYCLMSVKGCYTDFHIDMGGTSVWYHILHGTKIFWLIPPTEQNLELYEEWVLSAKQGDSFFADKVEKCQRIHLEAGWTFFIPTGWIHAVYTPEDSLVFGGNFLQSFSIPMQLRIYEVEDKTHVPQKFRYPFLGELMWYVLERYVGCLTGKHHRQKSEEELKEEQEEREAKEVAAKTHKSLFSPPDTEDEKSNDSRASEGSMSGRSRKSRRKSEEEQDYSPPRSPVIEEHNYVCTARPFRPKSPPQSPHSPRPASPKPASRRVQAIGEENAAPASPKSSDSRSAKGSKSDMAASADSRKFDQSGASKIKTFFGQSDLIKPVSVKLENCMLLGDRTKSLMEAGNNSKKPWQHLTPFELKGLQMLVEWMEEHSLSRRTVPKDIPDPQGLLRDIKKLLADHATDDPKLAITGECLIKWPPRKSKHKIKSTTYYTPRGSGPKATKGGSSSSGIRRRRVRCKKCEPCTRPDCGECNFCKDMKKYGGPGRMKQSCVSRQCMAPELPHSAICMICGKDERIKKEDRSDESDTTLMECGICWEIVHPHCLKTKNPTLTNEGVVNEDLPNSWECSKCCEGGKQGQLKPRVLKGGLVRRRESRQSSTSSEHSVEDMVKKENEAEGKRPKGGSGDGRDTPPSENAENQKQATPKTRSITTSGKDRTPSKQSPGAQDENQKSPGLKLRGRRPREDDSEKEGTPRKKARQDDSRSSSRGRRTPSPAKTPVKSPTPGLTKTTSRGREVVRPSRYLR